VQHSLSVLLPVRDAETTLSASVHDILDLAGDSVERFELLIIDDGSTDATSEVAHELTSHYPQVRVIRHGTPMGEEAALRLGMKLSQGEVVVTRDTQGKFRLLKRRYPAPSRSGPSRSGRPSPPNYLNRPKGALART
jgi:dolichol-phosphate mannosyltransferase